MTDNPQYPQSPQPGWGEQYPQGQPGQPGQPGQQYPQYPQYPQGQPGQQYPQYPQGQQYPPTGQGPAPVPPPSIVNAVRLMYAGAGLALLNAIVSLLSIGRIRRLVEQRNPGLSLRQVNAAVAVAVGVIVVVALIGVALWLWMAWANKRGKSWARILSTVFFGLATLDLVGSLAVAGTATGRLLGGVGWLVGLVTIIFLWQRASSEYYQAMSRPMGY